MQQSRRDKRCTPIIISSIGNGNFDYQPYHKLTNFLRPNYRAIFQSFNRPGFFCFYSRFFRTNINKVQTTKSSSLAFLREEAKMSKRSSHLSLLSREEVQKTFITTCQMVKPFITTNDVAHTCQQTRHKNLLHSCF